VRARRELPPALVAVLLIGPPLLLLLYAITYSVNGPEWDHLSSAEIFDRWNRPGGLTLEFLFSQHNEHRKAAARLATLGLGLLTDWNNRAEAVAHWALIGATALVLFLAFRRDLRHSPPRPPTVLLFVPISALLFSPRSYEALLGDGFPHYLSILSLASAVALLVHGRRWGTLAAAIVCGLIASFSISNGLLVWPLGVAILASTLRGPVETRARSAMIAVWTIVGAAAIATYFYDYVDPGNHTPPGFVLQHPLRAVAHLLAVSGSSLAPHPFGSVAAGVLVLTLQAWCLLWVWRDWRERRQAPPMPVWLMATVVPSVAMITLNRAEFGVPQAIDSRYTALTVLAPIAVYWCLLSKRHDWHVPPWLLRSVTALLIVGFVWATAHAWAIAPHWHSRKSWQAYLLSSAKYQPPSILERLYPNAADARRYSAQLEQLHLNVFAEPHVDSGRLSPGLPRPEYRIDSVNDRRAYLDDPLPVRPSDTIAVNGWALNESRTGPAPMVFLTVDGSHDFPGHVGIYRADLGGPVRGRARRWGGFVVSFDAALLSPGEHTLALKIVSDDRRRAFVTGTIGRVMRQ
jgi:hypothetical protein